MKKTIASMFETGVLHLVVLCLVFALALCFAGCSVTKINYEKDEKGVVSYRLYRNSHWLKMEGEGMRGGMSGDGKFEFDLEGMKSSPSEEFNRTMQTYTTAFVQLAQIAAAAYNPSSSAAVRGEGAAATQSDSGKARPSQIILEVPKTESQPDQVVAPKAETQPDQGWIMLTGSQSSTGNNTASDPHAADCTDGSCTTGACTDGSCNP